MVRTLNGTTQSFYPQKKGQDELLKPEFIIITLHFAYSVLARLFFCTFKVRTKSRGSFSPLARSFGMMAPAGWRWLRFFAQKVIARRSIFFRYQRAKLAVGPQRPPRPRPDGRSNGNNFADVCRSSNTSGGTVIP